MQQKDNFYLLITNVFFIMEKPLLDHGWFILKISIKHFAIGANFFGNSVSLFNSGSITWQSFLKKLKEHENDVSYKKCFSRWLLLKEGISTRVTVDRQAMQIFDAKRTLKKNFRVAN